MGLTAAEPDIFRRESKTKKALFLTMATTYGTKNSMYSIGLVQNEVTIDNLFLP